MNKQTAKSDDELMKEFAQLLYRDVQQYVETHMQEFESWQLEQEKDENSSEPKI